MNIVAGMAVGIAATFAALSAAASPFPDGGITADQVAGVLRDKGYASDIGKDDQGDPRIKSAVDGGAFYIYFYGCNGGPRCTGIQFEAAFHLKGGMPLAKINDWNKTHRWGRAYLDEVMDPYVEMDVDAEHGFTSEALGANLDTWNTLLPSFKKFIGWE
jgi:hypothetical protein